MNFADVPADRGSVLTADLEQIFSRTSGMWEEMRGGRLLLTGGTGFFGRWLLASFIDINARLTLDARVTVLSRAPELFRLRAPELANAPCVDLWRGDVSDFEFPQGPFSHTIHAAGDLNVAGPRRPIELIDTALNGARRVLEFSRQRGVRKLLFTSSGAVYGPAAHGTAPLPEDGGIRSATPDALGVYTESKRLAELICVLLGREFGVEIKIARGFAFFGPFMALNAHFAAASFLRAAVRNEEIVIDGDGKTVRSYLYGADLAVWLWVILFKGPSGRPYNLGSDVPVTTSEFATEIANQCSPPVTVRVLGRAEKQGSSEFYVPSVERARSELKLDVFTPLPEAIRRTLRFYKEV